MRAIGRLILLLVLIPVVYVASAVVYFPAVVWHRFVPPQSSELMEIRARAAQIEGRSFDLHYDWVPLDRISPHLLRGVLAAEDTRFYEHRGFDVEQIRKAWELNKRRGNRPMRGASTITQQTVKNLYLSPSRNMLRKAREALLTAWMELWLPKDRILELYLNVIELGPGIFGAEAASSAYFDGSARELSRDQAALLAATLPAPLARNPDRPTRALRRRQRMILSRMGRWYEGPSLAAEEATGEIAPEPLPGEPAPAMETTEAETLPAESLPFEPMPFEPETVVPAPADSAAPQVLPVPEAVGGDTIDR
jgi:monofunctional biosynthetic peptidoglycan transglycosylase